MNIQRIDRYYDGFAEARPEGVTSELGSKYVYIHRTDMSKPMGLIAQVRLHDPLQTTGSYVGYPPVEMWLNRHFHPQIKLQSTVNQRHRTVITGCIEMFDISMVNAPGLFDDPHCSLAEVYHCAAAFTYDMLYNGRGPALNGIDKIVSKGQATGANITRLSEDASLIIDQYITQNYKSLVRMAQELARYIRTKV